MTRRKPRPKTPDPKADVTAQLRALASAPPSRAELNLRIAKLLEKRKSGRLLTKREQRELDNFASREPSAESRAPGSAAAALDPRPSTLDSSSTLDEFVSSYEDLGRIFGPHRASFPRFRREFPDCPEPRADGRHPVADWRAFFERHPELLRRASSPEAALAGDKLALETERLREQVRDLKIGNDIRAGAYAPRAQLAQELVTLATEQKTMLRQKLENEYPALLPGLDETQRAEARRLGKTLVDQLCQSCQRLVDKWQT